ncbi:MAG: cytochrome P450, partial [Parvibaculaceae bacterium]|nr:cytochrome P450 [Parvibaculaceae bacterium]
MKISTDLANTIVAPKSYAHWEQSHAAFTELRKNSPLAVAEPTGYSPFWVASKFDDIQAIERQNDLFHNGDRAATLTSIAGDEMVRKLTGGSPHLVRSLVQMDNPDHRKYRMLTQSWFLPQNLRKLEDRIREIAVKFVDRMLAMDGKCDFALDVAFLYPLQVVMEVIGVPPEDEPKMLKLTQELFGSTDEDVSRSGKDADETDIANMVNEVIGDFFSYFTAMTADRRANPREDLASIIANGEIDGKP